MLVKTNGRFQSIAWSGMGAHQEQYTHGIIAGGMTDGTINIWDPAKLVKAHPQAQLSSMQPHRGAVNGVCAGQIELDNARGIVAPEHRQPPLCPPRQRP